MSKREILEYIRKELKDYERIKDDYKKKYGKKSEEYRLAEERYTTIWVLADDLGVEGV